MRTLTDAQTRAYAGTSRTVYLRVKIEDGDGTYQDMSSFAGFDWLIGAEWQDDIDAAGQTATVTLRRDAYHASLSYWREEARQNLNAGGAYDPLLELGRGVRIYIAVMAGGYVAADADYVQVFDGRILRVDWGADPITVECRDQIAVLQDRWIEAPGAYSDADGEPVEDIMQEILDDVLGGSAPTIYVPTSPGWMITEFQTEQQSLLDQLSLLADQIGWFIRYAWDSGTSAFRLTFYSPDRGKATIDREITATDYYELSQVARDITEIRNVIRVAYSDASSVLSDGSYERAHYEASDATSISAYGRRWMAICEADTSNINSAAEAQDMAEAVLSDLKEPKAAVVMRAPLMFFVELGDRHTLDANGVHADDDRDLSVVGYRHTVSATKAESEITYRADAPSGGLTRWYNRASLAGVSRINDELGPIGVDPTVIQQPGALKVVTPEGVERDVRYEIHVGASGFTPDQASLTATVAGRNNGSSLIVPADTSILPVATSRDVVAIPIDKHGNRGTGRRVSSVSTSRYGNHFLDPMCRIAGSFMGSLFNAQSRGTSYPPDGWYMSVGTWATDVDVDTGSIYSAPETGTKALTLKNTATATTLYTDWFPVSFERRYRINARWKASNNTNTVQLAIQYADAAFSIVSSTSVFNQAAAAANTWATALGLVATPSAARWARFAIVKQAAAFYVSFDRIMWEEARDLDFSEQGIRLYDDFIGGNGIAHGSLPWVKYTIGSDPASNYGTVDQVSVGTPTSWQETGIVELATPAAANYGVVLTLGTNTYPTLYSNPPAGTEWRCKLRLQGTTTNVIVWAGLWSHETTWPDAGPSNTIYGVGAVARSGQWYGIQRAGTSETLQSLSTAAGTSWVEVAWVRSNNGYRYYINGSEVGALTTNTPGSQGLSPMIGIYTTDTTAKRLQVDYYGLVGLFRRY